MIILSLLLSLAFAQTQTDHAEFCTWLLSDRFGQGLSDALTDFDDFGAIKARLATIHLMREKDRVGTLEQIERTVFATFQSDRRSGNWSSAVELIRYAQSLGDHARVERWIQFLSDQPTPTLGTASSAIKDLLNLFRGDTDTRAIRMVHAMAHRLLEDTYRGPVKHAIYSAIYDQNLRTRAIAHLEASSEWARGTVPSAENLARLSAELRGIHVLEEGDLELGAARRALHRFFAVYEIQSLMMMISDLPDAEAAPQMMRLVTYLAAAAPGADAGEHAFLRTHAPRAYEESIVDYASRLIAGGHPYSTDYASIAQSSSVKLAKILIEMPKLLNVAVRRTLGLRPSVAKSYLLARLVEKDLSRLDDFTITQISEHWAGSNLQAAEWALRFVGGQAPTMDDQYYFFPEDPNFSVIARPIESHVYATLQLKHALFLVRSGRPHTLAEAEKIVSRLSDSELPVPGKKVWWNYEEPFASSGSQPTGRSGSGFTSHIFVPLDFKINAWLDLAKAWPTPTPVFLDRAIRLDAERAPTPQLDGSVRDWRDDLAHVATRMRLSRELIRTGRIDHFARARRILDELRAALAPVDLTSPGDRFATDSFAKNLRAYLEFSLGAHLAAVSGGDRVKVLQTSLDALTQDSLDTVALLSLVDGAQVLIDSDFPALAIDLAETSVKHVRSKPYYERVRLARRLMRLSLPTDVIDPLVFGILSSVPPEAESTEHRELAELVRFWRDVATQTRLPQSSGAAIEYLTHLKASAPTLSKSRRSDAANEILRSLLDPRPTAAE